MKIIFSELYKESDRGTVVLTASIIDVALSRILKAYLLPNSSGKDALLEGALANLGTKINLVYRLGLISNRLCNDLHKIRNIRNAFAHELFECTFESIPIQSRMKELKKSEIVPFYTYLLANKSDKVQEGFRGLFLFLGTSIIYYLECLENNIESVAPSKWISTELIYKDGDEMIKRNKERQHK